MPRLVIDGREIEVPPGTKVMEAADRLGIVIPRLCFHPALGPVGACRVCAVMFVKGTLRGLNMSCMVDARDGMEVSTTDEEAVDFRRHVMEWLMLHHPHDCPVCDEGGHCLLQDMTVAGGHGVRRYLGRKRTYADQDLGPLVQHEMNRCIHCWRCRRFYQEFAGYRDLGALQTANRTYFGRQGDGRLESPFSGNLIDLCPTGVFTDKPSRYKGRRWDFQRSPSVCIHCSLGCNTVASARYREVVRMEGRQNAQVNGHFICDRGRYGFDYANHPGRPRQARLDGRGTAWEDALGVAAKRLREISDTWGPGAVACQGGLRSSLEAQGALRRLCKDQGWVGPGFFPDPETSHKVRSALAGMEPSLACSLGELGQADLALLVGADPLNEAPVMALALRQIHRRGGRVVVLDPRPVDLPLPFLHIPARPEDLGECVQAVLGQTPICGAGRWGEALRIGAEALRSSRRPILICGGGMPGEGLPALVGAAAGRLLEVKGAAGIMHILPGANAVGGAVLGAQGVSLADILEGMEAGRIRALVLVETDPFFLCPDGGRLREALVRLDFLAVLDYLPSEVASLAHVLLPTTTLYESGGTFVNHEGRAQRAQGVHGGGTPLRQWSGGSHPPRVYGGGMPGGGAGAAWEAVLALGAALTPGGRSLSPEELEAWMIREVPALEPIGRLRGEPDGVRLEVAGPRARAGHDPGTLRGQGGEKDAAQLLVVERTFGTEELSIRSPILEGLEPPPVLTVHSRDAGRLGLAPEDRVILDLDGGALEVGVEIREDMAPGVIILPRHRRLPWQRAGKNGVRLPWDKIRRAGP